VTADPALLLSGTYTGQVTAEASNGAITSVIVTLQVTDPSRATLPDAGVQYVLLLDPESFETRFETVAMPVNGQYQFALEVTPGSYYLVAGSDLDNDQFICTPGEACGAYAQVDQLELLQVGKDGLAGIEFITTFGASLRDIAVVKRDVRFPASGARRVVSAAKP
jgi:serine protease